MTEQRIPLGMLAQQASHGHNSLDILHQVQQIIREDNGELNRRMAFDIGVLAAANCNFIDIESQIKTLSLANTTEYNDSDGQSYTLIQICSTSLFFNNIQLFRNIAIFLSRIKVMPPELLRQRDRIGKLGEYPLENVKNWRDVLLSNNQEFLETALHYMQTS